VAVIRRQLAPLFVWVTLIDVDDQFAGIVVDQGYRPGLGAGVFQGMAEEQAEKVVDPEHSLQTPINGGELLLPQGRQGEASRRFAVAGACGRPGKSLSFAGHGDGQLGSQCGDQVAVGRLERLVALGPELQHAPEPWPPADGHTQVGGLHRRQMLTRRRGIAHHDGAGL